MHKIAAYAGYLQILPPPDVDTISLINGLHKSRRMARDLSKLATILGMTPEAALAAYGVDGEFFTDTQNAAAASVINRYLPPETQPSLFCPWHITENKQLRLASRDYFHSCISWLRYLITNIFIPRNYIVNGHLYCWISAELGSELISVTRVPASGRVSVSVSCNVVAIERLKAAPSKKRSEKRKRIVSSAAETAMTISLVEDALSSIGQELRSLRQGVLNNN